ncbi:MAG: peptidoglycan DD-metalloendopeptidase family protein [Lachnospiraceae bacterium]|nr:peptidoglycan DD-metalloendopeptidase family protein [Lachnospiraceae bacterium]MEE0863096.1 peptidoglycan DD-metalloendopeptidase family protein [Lachnospiraceae bacterium]
MTKKMMRLLRLLVVTSVVIYVSLSLVRQNYAASIEEEKKKQEEMQKELKNTEKYLKELETLKGNTQAYIKELDVRLNQLTDNIYEIESQISVKKGEIEATKLDIEKAKEDINSRYESMKLRIQYMYENGESSYIDMILGSQNMNELFTRAEYLSKITAYDREQLEKLQLAKEELDAKEATLIAEEAELEGLLNEAQAEQNATEDLIAAKRDVVEGYASDISDAEAEKKNLLEDIETQKAIIAELEEIERKRREEALKNQLNLTYDGGKMTWPVPGYSRISSYYGTRPDPFGSPTQEFHSGIDIPAPRGVNIISAYDGEVAWSYYSNSAGNWVGVDHGDGIYTVYMHMSKRLVSEGDKVKKGDVLGLVGTTGRSTGNHLHFAVRQNGSYVDPLKWVSP